MQSEGGQQQERPAGPIDVRAPHFYREEQWPKNVTFCSEGAAERIRSGSQHEPDVTRLLAFFAPPFADAIARILLDLAGVAPQAAPYDTYVGSEWKALAGNQLGGDRRSPDIVVTDLGAPERVRLIVEVKGTAAVNGDVNYCPTHREAYGYANQVICYATNCWTSAKLDTVPRLLIGPDAHHGQYGGWGPKGLVLQDVDRHSLGAAFAAQQRALLKWRFAGLRELVARIEGLPASPARNDATAILTGWLERRGL